MLCLSTHGRFVPAPEVESLPKLIPANPFKPFNVFNRCVGFAFLRH